jgi:biopolymer transport protein ExbB
MSINSRLSIFFAAVLMSSALVSVSAIAADDPAAAPATATAPAAAPADAATPVAPPVIPLVSKETVDNPYGLDALWKGGDFVARGTLIILVIMSMGSWYILITKLFDQFKMMGQARDARSKFWKASSVNAGVTSLKEGSPFRFIAENGIKASDHHDGALLEQIDLNTWITMSIQRATEKVQSRLQDGLSFLATVGSTAPFVGLFGTVWGIYHALTAIGIAGQASIDKVAGLGYNWLVRRNKGAMEEVRSFSSDLHSVLLSGAMSSSEAGRAATVKKIG